MVVIAFSLFIVAAGVAIASAVSQQAAQWHRLAFEKEKHWATIKGATAHVAAPAARSSLADPYGRIEPTIGALATAAVVLPEPTVVVPAGQEDTQEVDGIFPDQSLSRKVHANATVEVHIYRREFQRATRRVRLSGDLSSVNRPMVPLPVVECEGMSDEDVLKQAAAHALAVVQAALDERNAITLRPVRRVA